MTKRQAIKRAKEMTMGCWWPSRPFSSVADCKAGPNWEAIKEELKVLTEMARTCRQNEAEASEYETVANLLPTQNYKKGRVS